MSGPYVDRPVNDIDRARDAAARALATWGEHRRPELIRVGMNALFEVPGSPIVVRVGHATAPADAAHRLATVIGAAGIRTVVPIDGWAIDIGDLAVTAWERVRETRQAVRWEAVGEAVRRVHELDADTLPVDYPRPSPVDFPWWHFERLLGDLAADLDAPARAGIVAAIDRNAWWADAVAETERVVVCHGDVHPGNVLTAPGGPLLLDWDLLCAAPPEWDHAVLAGHAARWGSDPSAYPRFAEGYGKSLADDPLTLALGELRNVAATLLRVRAGRTDQRAAAEAERRLRLWRGDPDAPVWQPQ